MINLDQLLLLLRENGMEKWAEKLPEQIEHIFSSRAHGDVERWKEAIEELPEVPAERVELSLDAVTSTASSLSEAQRTRIDSALKKLHPWRKGPFDLHGVYIDTEWRSDWKWRRIAPHISPLEGRSVLDVGCGNGYYGWRMLGAGARFVLGVDPTWLFLMQFLAVRHFVGEEYPFHVLPMGIEDVPGGLKAFDTVFSMGVLYHRRSPIDHLLELRETLRNGGELVLETLVVEGGVNQVLMPRGRYAKMRNVWFIPSPEMLKLWLQRAGFNEIEIVDLTPTTIDEQRSTEWMQFESLPDFLDPGDHGRTIEGYPAPVRAVVVATA